ncbi:MAG: hypothetical protein GY714_00710 [Desulfobacterales bacterium]|nr:hypothetical protein [Desulfobacterales bacterium]
MIKANIKKKKLIENTPYRCGVIGMRKTKAMILDNDVIKWFNFLSIKGHRMDGVDHGRVLSLLGDNVTGIEKLSVSGSSVSYSGWTYLRQNFRFFHKLSSGDQIPFYIYFKNKLKTKTIKKSKKKYIKRDLIA